MPDAPGTLEVIARELGAALAPLEQRLSVENAPAFLADLGVVLPGGYAQAATAIGTTAVKAGALPPLVIALIDAIEAEDAGAILAAAGPLLGAIREVVDAVAALEPALDAALTAAAGLTPAQRTHLEAQVAALPGRLVEWALLEHLAGRSEGLYRSAVLLGIVEDVPEAGDPADPVRPPLRRRTLHLDRLVAMVTAPQDYLRSAFRFGAADFDGMALFGPLADFLESLDVAVDLLTPPGMSPVLEAYVLRLSTDPTAVPPSLTAQLRIPATRDVAFTVPLGSRWALTVAIGARFEAGLGVEVHPPLEIRLQPPTGSIGLAMDVGLAAARPDSSPMVLLGEAGGSRLELRRFTTTIGIAGSAGIGQPVQVEPRARLEVEGGRLVVDFSNADGFIGAVAGGFGIDANLDLAALWSPSTGLQVEGSGGIEIAVPTHIQLGPLQIITLYLRVTLADAAIPIELSGAFSVDLGALRASVDRIGLIARLSFPDGGGNLGPVDLGFEFKPPNGVGLVVDAGMVRGGGYLFIDTERGEYAGALELDIAGIVTVAAIGIITTRMPDGSEGFSLLLVITAEFGTGIQLGFGFTLLAVGGILGLHRTMNLPALVEGVRSNALSSVMFPRDVVANAQRIITDLRTFFPPQQDTFLIGPMAKIGWGTPTLVSLSLGVIIEIPGNIAIVGVLRVALPADEAAVIVLQVNFLGAIEFDKSRVYFFAAIYDSRILFLTIEGEMALLAQFGDQADFVLSVGGFHPDFTPPPLPVPIPRRIAVDVVNTATAKLRVEGYFAVTTNTAQFGARLDLLLGFPDFGVQGHLGFDALIQFSPFQFVLQVSASVSLRVFGFDTFSIRLRFALSGPTPWRARGTGSISLLFWDFEVDFDESFGEERHTTLPDVKVIGLLTTQLGKDDAWRTLLPTGAAQLVALRVLDPVVDTLVLHPVGLLEVSQRLLPLDQTFTKLGNSTAVDANRLSLEVTGGGLAKAGDVPESFAPGQFVDLSEADRLARPAYETGHGGITLSASGSVLRTGPMVRRMLRYEVITVDTGWRRHVRRFRVVLADLFSFFLVGGAVARNPLSQHREQLLQPFADSVTTAAEGFAVASALDNSVVATFPNRSMAEDHLATRLAADPTGALHVVPAFEAVAR